MKKEIFLLLVLIIVSPIVSAATVTVSAYIDGVSSLVIQGDTVHWHHSDWAAPGRWDENDYPTTINGINWTPTWPSEGSNESCNCDSSSISGLFTALPASAITVHLNSLNSPGQVTILEQPSLSNGYSLIIQFDDYYRGGASWYNIELSYPAVPLPASMWLFGSALSLLSIKSRRLNNKPAG
jgi:hypothetical protein